MFRNRGLAEGLNRLKRIAVFKLYCLRNREEGGSYTTVDGRKMFLRTDDYGISLSLALDGLREKDHYQRVREFLEEGDTVLEVGANIGYFALLEAEEVGETGFVYAVEPISENIELMRKSLESNSFDNFELFEIAMSEETGEAEINLASNSNTHTMSEP